MNKQFKIRCSQIGQIMTNPRSKSELLSQTTKTYCQNWLKEQIYDRKKEIGSKYFDKGNMVEAESIEFISNYLNLGMIFKNEESFENEWMTGTPDLILPNEVIDMKNSWDCFTFPLFEAEIEKNYWWQLQGYMELTGKTKARLIYTLMDTPDELIDRELNFAGDISQDEYEKLIRSHQYGDVNPKYRVKIFEIEKDEEAIKSIRQRVEECRIYLETIKF